MKKNLKEVADKMKDIDFCMMTTMDNIGEFHSRPMSTNKDIDYDGDSLFFTYEDSEKVINIKNESSVSLNFIGDNMVFIHVYGKGKILKDKEIMKKHWKPEFKIWFPEGIDTPGIAMIHVSASKIKYWNKDNEMEINVDDKV